MATPTAFFLFLWGFIIHAVPQSALVALYRTNVKMVYSAHNLIEVASSSARAHRSIGRHTMLKMNHLSYNLRNIKLQLSELAVRRVEEPGGPSHELHKEWRWG